MRRKSTYLKNYLYTNQVKKLSLLVNLLTVSLLFLYRYLSLRNKREKEGGEKR